jgi:hypothetical protein
MGGDSQSRRIVGMGGFPSAAAWENVLSLARGRRVLVDHAASPEFGGLPDDLAGESSRTSRSTRGRRTICGSSRSRTT